MFVGRTVKKDDSGRDPGCKGKGPNGPFLSSFDVARFMLQELHL
jgi:hypothetical protein